MAAAPSRRWSRWAAHEWSGRTWFGCRDGAEVVLYSIDGLGHEWPKANSLGGFDASATIWKFFELHRISR